MDKRQTAGFGWRPQLPDTRDFQFDHKAALTKLGLASPAELPVRKDARPAFASDVYNQGPASSCVGNAVGRNIEYQLGQQGLPVWTPSRLMIYYGARDVEGTACSDSGCEIRDAIKFVAQSGVCPETEWPYDLNRLYARPDPTCYTDAAKHLALRYEAVAQDDVAMRTCLAAGFPIVVGFTVYTNIYGPEASQQGHLSLPGPGDTVVGGHAVLVVGYAFDNKIPGQPTAVWIVENSWGAGWGERGFFSMPASYLTNPNLAGDFWKISLVS